MSRRLLVLRPEPGAGATIARAAARGLRSAALPLFAVDPIDWDAPDPASYDAILLTSANALRHGGAAIGRYVALPAYAVGRATAKAAAAAGFTVAGTGLGDVTALLATLPVPQRLLHLAGREHRAAGYPGLSIDRRPVYASDPIAHEGDAVREAAAGRVALLHSPRAAARFAELIGLAREGIRIAAISPAALAAAGGGWTDAAAARSPDDDALLALAARLCD